MRTVQLYKSKMNGFCNGVKRAVDMTADAAARYGRVFCLGELVHNKRVTDYLKGIGVEFVDTVQAAAGGVLVIRAHGAAKRVYDECEQKGITVVDATCPSITRMHAIVERKYKDGYRIVIVGESRHPEVIGINGWCDDKAIIWNGEDKLDLIECEKVFLLYQTTLTYEKSLAAAKNIVKEYAKTLEVFDSICYTTKSRQECVKTIVNSCGHVIIVGDGSSTNTRRLYDIAVESGCSAELIEDARMLSDAFLRFDNVALLSGASTPVEVCDEVEAEMVRIARDRRVSIRVVCKA
ncbi:MAG: 4-hydroxy-3-methylbut-2-enyl diphosphate reductase [Clostridia bacterium]|nr:4-hydroxy-3-methylbut-2-enyl diphosphate reductase [Clostridia bacterium]